MARRPTVGLQSQISGELRKGCRSLGSGTVLRFSRIWMSSGECRLKSIHEGEQAPLPMTELAAVTKTTFTIEDDLRGQINS